MAGTAENETTTASPKLTFWGGALGALAPFLLFFCGVTALALSGAPDERGFWPVLLAAMALGLILAKDRTEYSETLILGMSQPVLMLMVMAWLLAGVLGVLMTQSGFVEALVWLANGLGVSGGAYAATAFLICCVISTSVGTSLGTILLCGPLLYPPGGALGADPALLAGAILGGATFGDNVSPISDTTIASALSQEADIGGVVRSRMRYALPAAAVACALAFLFGAGDPAATAGDLSIDASPASLPMVLSPIVVIILLLRRRHLIEGLFVGILLALAIALPLGLISPGELLYLDRENFGARGLILQGLERGLGASIITLFLMGMVATLEVSGLLERLIAFSQERARSPRGAETWIFAAMTLAMLLITHTTVAILAVGRFTRETGERFGISGYRRANLLDVTGCTAPFILPYMIPVILAASTTAGAQDYGMPRLAPHVVGLANLHSWLLLAIIVFAIATGWGRGGTDASA